MITISAMNEEKIIEYVEKLQHECACNGIEVTLTPQLYCETLPNYWELKMRYERALGASTLLRASAQIAFVGVMENDYRIVKIFYDAQENALTQMYNANSKR